MKHYNKRSAITSTVLLLSALTSTGPYSVIAQEQQQQDCGLWLGPSTLSTADAPKLGLYSGVDMDENATVGYPEIAIPLIDFIHGWYRINDLNDDILDFLEGNLWTADYAGNSWEGTYSVVNSIPGYGTLANYHSGTHNVDFEHGSVLLKERLEGDPPLGKPHPSRGAISPYYNITMRTTQPVKAGMELFANFGDVWDGNSTDDIYQDQLKRWDYEDADKIVDSILGFMDKYEDTLTPERKDRVLDFLFDKVLRTAAGTRSKVLRSLIPAHPAKLATVKKLGGTFQYRNPDLVKSSKWLNKHCRCVDNLKGGQSTIPHAGRGAFATRSIAKGSVIAPTPLLHIPDEDILTMFELNKVPDDADADADADGDDSTIQADFDKPIGKQIMTNYVFGHPESSMVLYPVGPVVNLINHQAGKKANAELRWSSLMKNDYDWHDMNPEDLVNGEDMHRFGLIMEFVATRDIKEGDEIFLDYGPEWTQAWDQYMRLYNANYSAKSTTWPLRASDVKEQYKQSPLKIPTELREESYPEGITTACFVETVDQIDGRPKTNADGKTIERWAGPLEFSEYEGIHFHLCDVLERKEVEGGAFNYTVLVHAKSEQIQVEDVPHHAVSFVDKPYQSDLHIQDAFRHSIGFPDAIFPQAWRNRNRR